MKRGKEQHGKRFATNNKPKRRIKKLNVSLAFFCIIILLVFARNAGSILAYFTSEDSVKNVFTIKATYTISFDSNSGTGTMEDQIVSYNKAEPLNANTFTKEGFYFNGWNTKADGSGETFEDKQEITNLEDGTILYAQWVEKIIYYVEFNSNGGTGTMETQEFEYDAPEKLTKSTFTNGTNSFAYWNTEPDGTGDRYEDEELINNLASINGTTITLYAIYNINSYVYNGDYYFDGSNYINTGVNLFNDENVNKDFEVSFEIVSRETDTKQATLMSAMDETGKPWPGIVYRLVDGKDQLGANTHTALEVETNYDRAGLNKVTIRRIAGNLYISFNDGGNQFVLDMSSIDHTFDVPLAFGASLKPDLTPQRFFVGTLRNMSVKIVDNTNIVIFDGNGSSNTMLAQSFTGKTITLNSNTLTRPNYAFAGWNTKADGSGTSFADGATINDVSSLGKPITLYAQWNQLEYTVKFNANGGTGTMEDQVVGAESTTNLNPNAFTKPGKDFICWNTKQDGTGKSFKDGSEIHIEASEYEEVVNLYAMWGYKYADTTFDGTNYINTGIQLFSEENKDKNFEISFNIDECVSTGNQDTLISAMDESGNPYPGFVFRVANGGQLEISANVTNNLKANPRYNRNATSVAIRRIDGILYASINGGAFSQVLDMNSIQTFDSNLAIGASLNGSGNPQRYFKGTLSDINIIFDD